MRETLMTPDELRDPFNQILDKIKVTLPEEIYVTPGAVFGNNSIDYVTIYNSGGNNRDTIGTEKHLTIQNIPDDPRERYTKALKSVVTASERVQKIKDALKDISPKTIIVIKGPKNTDQMLKEARIRKIKPYPTIKM